jgi:hypothetical protein
MGRRRGDAAVDSGFLWCDGGLLRGDDGLLQGKGGLLWETNSLRRRGLLRGDGGELLWGGGGRRRRVSTVGQPAGVDSAFCVFSLAVFDVCAIWGKWGRKKRLARL